MEYLGFGRTAINREAVEFIVTKFSDLTDKLLPLLQKYPIVGYKYLDYLYFVKAVELMKNKAHLTEEGLNLLFPDEVGRGPFRLRRGTRVTRINE